MNDIETCQALDLADRLEKTHASKILFCANALLQMRPDREMTAGEEKLAVGIAGRAFDLMPGTDEPRFCLHDYIDGIANARKNVDFRKLLGLSDEGFIEALVWLAADKRETYEDREHCQEPLALDIYG